MSAKESPEVSCEEKEVEAFTGDSDVLGSDTEPASDIEAEEFSAAEGRHPERLDNRHTRARHASVRWRKLGIDTIVEQPRHRHRLAALAQHTRPRPARHVGPEPDAHPRIECSARRKHGIGEVGIRQRAVRHPRPASAYRREVVIAQVVTVSQHRVVAQQAEPVEGGGV